VTAEGAVQLQKTGSDKEMEQAVLFLAKNAFVNGKAIAVDGGLLNLVAGRCKVECLHGSRN
jgi:hypothetical protein